MLWGLKHSYYRIGVILGLTLSVGQQLTGINVFVSQSNKLFESFVPHKWVSFTTCMVGILNVFMTALMIPMIDRFGRRPLMLTAATGTVSY